MEDESSMASDRPASEPITARHRYFIKDREEMFALIRETMSRIESGEIEAAGIAFIVPFNRVHEVPVLAGDDHGNVAPSTRTMGLVADVALPASTDDAGSERRHAVHELFMHGVRSVLRDLSGYLLREEGESPMPKPTAVREEFSVHRLNSEGLTKADVIATAFSRLLDHLEEVCGKDGREMSLVRTKLQESAFYAKRAMAVRPENQQTPTRDE